MEKADRRMLEGILRQGFAVTTGFSLLLPILRSTAVERQL